MTRIEETTIAGPEVMGGQGLDPEQEESGNRAIHFLLTDPVVGPQTDLVITYRNNAYEVWASRGMVRFQRVLTAQGTHEYRVVEEAGENPIKAQDYRALATIEEELEAGRRSGYSGEDPARAFVEPEHLSYPDAYERIAQLFDSPDAPDLAISPRSYAFGRQPGQHGSLDVVQSRCVLALAGPGVRAGTLDAHVREVDIAPTIAHLMGFPLIDGCDATGRSSTERGVPPDVYLRRQDGRVLAEAVDDAALSSGVRPQRVYIFLMDGVSHTELLRRLAEPGSIPNIRRLIERSAFFRYGAVATFPSITWPSHNAIGTGAWSGHHGIVNPTYYLRAQRRVVSPQGQIFGSAAFLSPAVETLYEAFHRVYGPWNRTDGAFTASIHEPCTRGADHSVLERSVIGDRERLRGLTAALQEDTSSRWAAEGQDDAHRESVLDNRGIAQVEVLFTDPSHPQPIFVFQDLALPDGVAHDYGPHSDGMRTALDETDVRIGRVLSLLERLGLFESTLFVIASDHGMAPQMVELAADQAQAVIDAGFKGVAAAPFVYLLDMAVRVEPASDGRTVTITVTENDPDESGERPPLEGAEVMLRDPSDRTIGQGRTDAFGVVGLPLPANLPPESIVVSVRHERFNSRQLRLSGEPVTLDLRRALYPPDIDRHQ